MNPYAGRKYLIGGVILLVGIIYVIRLFFIQVVESSYKSTAESNARREEIQYPARGLIYDRNREILVYNEAAYDLMINPSLLQEFDTLDFCRILEINRSDVIERIQEARDYSYYKSSIFLRQISSVTYAVMQEKLYKFPGFLYSHARSGSIRVILLHMCLDMLVRSMMRISAGRIITRWVII